MFVYVSKVFTASATGSQLKEVVCEKCGKQFFYQLSRVGVGVASAPYMIGQSSAKKSSEKGAATSLQKRLAADQETVPCPACQWINESAVRSFRKTRQKGWPKVALAIGIFGAVISLTVFGMSADVLREAPSLANPVHWIIAGIWLLLVGLCFLLQWLLRSRIDPNKITDGKKRLPVGTPPAIVAIGADGAGSAQYEVVPYDLTLINTSSKWAIFRAGQFGLLPVCCRCLGEPSTSLKLPFVVQAQPMPVPMCEECRRAIIKHWWVANITCTAVAIGGAWLLTLVSGRMDDVQKAMVIILGGGFAAGVGFCAIDELIRPYRHKLLDAERGISRIRFRNPAYTALLIRKVGEADGYFKASPSGAAS